MPIQREMLRIESKELMDVLTDAAVKMNKKNRGSFSYDVRVERDAFMQGLLPQTLATAYVLQVTYRSGALGIGGAKFTFEAESLEEVYKVAIATVKAWSDEYFKTGEGIK